MKKMNKKGFTIVELVIVIAVIAILAAVLIPTFATVIRKANENAAVQAAKNAYTAYLAENENNIITGYDLKIFTGKYEIQVKDNKLDNSTLTGSNHTVTAYTTAVTGGGMYSSGTTYAAKSDNNYVVVTLANGAPLAGLYEVTSAASAVSDYTFAGTFEGCDVYYKTPTP